MKYRSPLRLVATFRCVLPTLLVAVLVFNGCTELKEAGQRREKRLLEKRNASSLMLKPSNAAINIREDALFGKSDTTRSNLLKICTGFQNLTRSRSGKKSPKARSVIWRAFTMR